MNRPLLFAVFAALGIAMTAGAAPGAEPVSFDSPGFPPSSIDVAGRLVEDWGAVDLTLQGPGVTEGPTSVESVLLDDVVPAARAASDRGAVRLIRTAFRAPAFPSGVDVLCVRIEEAIGKPAEILLGLELPEGAIIGTQSVRLQNRTVLTLPAEAAEDRPTRPWGYCDDATSLPNWAKPQGACDPAFRHIRAGMGGVPIVYRFAVQPKSERNVVLGFCESHWAVSGQRPLSCRVEGAAVQTVDPVRKWGQHKPGVLQFRGRDANGDGRLEVVVRAAPGAADRNSILNAIWVFPTGDAPNLERIVAGELSGAAEYYVDVGGPADQSIYPPGKLEYRITLPAGGAKELTILAACQDGSSPLPDASAWTPELLRRAAREVWRDWPKQ